MSDQKFVEQIKELVIARLQVLPPDASISIGSEGSFTRDELIVHVKKNDELGKKITEVELEYLKMLKEGIFYAQNNSNY
ncbi:MAG: hypothetical protein HYV37_03005 [Candidatus Levyibacteriota bacterium]|nr:MAG: hypothetical protein HYV37_03005 [Candidatus Levybacteria bacterium]